MFRTVKSIAAVVGLGLSLALSAVLPAQEA